MWKFLHCADIHLDSPLRGLDRYEGAPRTELRRSTRLALANLVELALQESVACVVIAGDLYDGNWHDHGTGLYLNSQMARLRDAGIKVYVIRGNHDAESQITRHLTLPDNVVQLRTDEPETVIDEDFGLAVHGQGFATRAVTLDLSERYPARRPQYFNIGILHTSLNGRIGHEPYAPSTLDGLRRLDYDYWALGHIHKYEELHTDPPIVFSGNVQGRHARETGPKGCTLVTVEGGRVVRHERRALDVVRWSSVRIDAEGLIDLDDVLDRVSERLAVECERADGRLLAARVEIIGSCPAHEVLAGDPERVANEVRNLARDLGSHGLWVEKVKLQTSAESPTDAGEGPVGVLLDLIQELQSDEPRLRQLIEADSDLRALKRKLPSDLRSGDEPLDLDSLDLLREVLGGLGPAMVRGLTGRGEIA